MFKKNLKSVDYENLIDNMNMLNYIIELFLIVGFVCQIDKQHSDNNIIAIDKLAATNTRLKKLDTAYIQGSALIVKSSGQLYEYGSLVVNAMSLNTDLVEVNKNENRNRFYLHYNYTASTVKNIKVLELVWKDEQLSIDKIHSILYDGKNDMVFGWTELYTQTLQKNADIDYIEGLTTINDYKINAEKNEVIITSDKGVETVEENVKDKTSLWPVFIDGKLEGHYEVQGNVFASPDKLNGLKVEGSK